MALRFDKRVVVVTGGGRGMGRAHCLEFARRGARLVVNDLGGSMTGEGADASVAAAVVAEIHAAGGEAVSSVADVATEAGASKIISDAIGAFGRVDAIVHNAGIVGFAPIEALSFEEYRRVVSVHLDASFLIARAAWPHMVSQGFGRLVFITSQTALSGLGGLAHYGSAKAGLTGLSRVLALEGAPHGIQSNCLGVTAMTRMMADFFVPSPERRDPNRPENLSQSAEWWDRYNRPEMVSPVVAYLGHEHCRLTGELLDTGGGHTSRQYLATTEGYLDLDLTAEAIEQNLERIMDGDAAHDPFNDAAEFLDWRHAKLVAAGATLGKASVTETAS